MVKVNLPGFSRRTLLGAAMTVPVMAGTGWLIRQYMGVSKDVASGPSGESAAFKVYPTGYGPDPELIYPERMIWPSRLTDIRRGLLSWAADQILPPEGGWPSASEVDVPAFLDEWLSAPYPDQVADFDLIIPMLDEIAKDEAANGSRSEAAELMRSSKWQAAHDRLTELVVAGYFCSRRGNELLGFIGNQPSDHFAGPPKAVISKLEDRLVVLGGKSPGVQPMNEVPG